MSLSCQKLTALIVKLLRADHITEMEYEGKATHPAIDAVKKIKALSTAHSIASGGLLLEFLRRR